MTLAASMLLRRFATHGGLSVTPCRSSRRRRGSAASWDETGFCVAQASESPPGGGDADGLLYSTARPTRVRPEAKIMSSRSLRKMAWGMWRTTGMLMSTPTTAAVRETLTASNTP